MRTTPSPTCDTVTIVVFHVVAHSLHTVQTLASPVLHSSPTHPHISCAGLDTVFLWNMPYILLCSLFRSPFVNKSLSTEQPNAKYNRLMVQYTVTWYTMLYIRSCWIPTLFVVKTTLVHQLPTLHAMCWFTLYWDGVFSYLPCPWIVQERFKPGISFITYSNTIWQPFFALLKNWYAWTIAVFTTNPSINSSAWVLPGIWIFRKSNIIINMCREKNTILENKRTDTYHFKYTYNTDKCLHSKFIVNYVMQFFFIILYLFYHFILFSMNSNWSKLMQFILAGPDQHIC